ncbi:MAG TPA: methyltransferase domain-containing protein [Vicinamibacterales bacterium]|nr:methyltransferase domain-containing protein [Vicinamibacterales bacterium]
MTMWKIAASVMGLGLAGTAGVLYVGFGAFLPWRERSEAARVADLTGLGQGQVVAEIGAGSGRFAGVLADRVGMTGRVIATELPGETLDRLKVALSGRSNVSVVAGAKGHAGLPEACCDLVIMRNVYHHAGGDRVFADELRRAVRPGGRLVVIDFAPGGLWFHGDAPADATARRPGHGVAPDVAVAELAGAGFVLDRLIQPWVRPMWLALFVRRR